MRDTPHFSRERRLTAGKKMREKFNHGTVNARI